MNSQEITAMATEAMKVAPKKKTVKMTKEPIHLGEGMVARPVEVKGPSDAYRALMMTLMKHTADVFEAVVEIIAEKHHLKRDAIIDEITAHPKWHRVLDQPVIYDIVVDVQEKKVEVTAPPEEKKKRVYKKKTAAPAAASVPVSVPVPVPEPAPVATPEPAKEEVASVAGSTEKKKRKSRFDSMTPEEAAAEKAKIAARLKEGREKKKAEKEAAAAVA